MSQAPAVTAIVLHYGDPAATARCLASLAAARYALLDVVVVNNNAADTWREAAPGRVVQVLRPDGNRGFAGGNNLALRGLASRDAPYALLLNNDAVLEPDAIARLVACAATDPRIALVGARVVGDCGDELDHGAVTFGPYLVERPAPVTATPGDTEWVSGCALLVRLATLRDIGLLDEAFFLYGEDVDWCLRARRAGYRVLYQPEAVVRHGGAAGPAVTARRAYFLARNAVRLARKHGSVLTRARTLAATALLPAASLLRRGARGEALAPAAWVWRGFVDGLLERPPRLAALGLAVRSAGEDGST